MAYSDAKTNLKTYNGILNRDIRQAKQNYYSHQFDRYKNDIKKTWDTIKSIMNKKRSKSEFPNCFFVDGKLIDNKSDIAESFNKYFTNIGPELAKSINTSNKPTFKSYLKNHPNFEFAFEFTNAEIISKMISQLPPKTSCGHDNISSKLLKEIKDIVSPSLSIIINQSLFTGIFPDKLKLAKLVPLFKKDNMSLLGNYRPISLLPTVSKIFERVVFIQLYDYFQDNKLFYKSQYGFRKHHPTELAALELIDQILKDLDRKQTPFSIFLDLSKAFDTLDHHILLHKLRFYGIKGTPLKWFENYLSDRKQYVDIDGTCSTTLTISTGVPQGSILGPLLFIIYMNDIHTASDKFHFIIYADDTTLTGPLCSFTSENISATAEINKEIVKISDWFAVNKLSLNATKTKFMVYHFIQKKLSENDIPKLKVGGIEIERVSEFNFLGLMINENMNWKSHTDKLCNKISRTLGVLNKLKRFLPMNILKIMYNSMILPYLQFGVKLWGFEQGRLKLLQKRAIRIITLSKYNAHTEPLFKDVRLLQLEHIFKLACLKFYYKLHKNQLPCNFSGMLTRNSEIHAYYTRHSDDYHRYGTRTVTSSHCLRHYLPKLLEETPDCIINCIESHSYEGFSSYVKTFYINSYRTECLIPNCYICSDRQLM